MTYEETLAYIYDKLPMYQRIGTSAFKKDLTNITKLCEALGNPQNAFKSIHIAGTNGKGSTSHILSAIYQKNGYNVGLYTSPHLVDFRERIKINGELCSKDFVINFITEIKPLIENIQPSFFEITVAMAFSYFAEQEVDVAIIETGLGGRLDSTNIIHPIACIITSIGYDHKDMLGDTLELIAGEKAGIIKRGIPIVTGNISASPLAVITNKAEHLKAPHHELPSHKYETDLAGPHQQWNINAAVKCIDLINTVLPTQASITLEALKSVRKISNFYGRWQILNKQPLVICDVGHNEEGFRLISEQLNELNKKIHFVLGFVKGKEIKDISPILPVGESYHFVKPNVIRGLDPQEASDQFAIDKNIKKDVHSSLGKALNAAYSKVKDDVENSILFIGGSNFVVADLLTLEQSASSPWNA